MKTIVPPGQPLEIPQQESIFVNFLNLKKQSRFETGNQLYKDTGRIISIIFVLGLNLTLNKIYNIFLL